MANFPSDATFTHNSITYSMSDKKPDKGISRNTTIPSARFTPQIAVYSKSRLISRRRFRTFSLQYTNLSGPYKEALEDFYYARNGTHESFIFDLTYIGSSGTTFVRFDSDLNIADVLLNSDVITDFYTVSFNLVETAS